MLATWWLSTTSGPFPSSVTRARSQARLAGGWRIAGVAQFQTGAPCGVGMNTDYAGVGEYGSFGCGSEGEFWVKNGTPKILHQFAGYRRNGQVLLHNQRRRQRHLHRSACRNLQSPAGCKGLHLPARLPGLESLAQEEVHDRSEGLHGVYGGCLQLHQPSQLVRAKSELQPLASSVRSPANPLATPATCK